MTSSSHLPSTFRVLSPSFGCVPWADKCHLQLSSHTPTEAGEGGWDGGLISALSSPLFSIKCATFLPRFTHCERHPHTGLSVSPGQLLLSGHVPTDAAEAHYLSRLTVGRRSSCPHNPCPLEPAILHRVMMTLRENMSSREYPGVAEMRHH